jgi:hypothetical protein
MHSTKNVAYDQGFSLNLYLREQDIYVKFCAKLNQE